MPRISKFNGEYNDNMDFCLKCYPAAKKKYPVDDNTDHDVTERPDYSDVDYDCETCKKKLTDTNA